MSHRTHAPLLLLVACLAVLAAVGAVPAGAGAAVDGAGADAAIGASGDATGGAGGPSVVVAQDGGLNATFERDGTEVVVRVNATAFGENETKPSGTISLVDYNRSREVEGTRRGEEYVFRVGLRQLVDDAPVTSRRVRVRLSTGSGNATGQVDARYLEFPNQRVAMDGGSFGLVVRSIGFGDGTEVPMRVAERNGRSSATFDATLRSGANATRLWFDPSMFAGDVSPLASLQFTAFPDDALVNASRRANLTTHATARAATFAADGDRVDVGHPLLFAGDEYVVVAETTDPQGRYVRNTTAERSGAVGTVSVPGSVTAARTVNVSVLAGVTPVFRGASPASESREVNATWRNASRPATFRFGGGLPDSIRTVWFAHDGRVWSVSGALPSDGANLTVPGDALSGTGQYGLLVVGGDGSVLRGEATVTQPEGTTAPPSTSANASSTGGLLGGDSGSILFGVAAFLLGMAVTLVTANRPLDGDAVGYVLATVGVLFWLFGTLGLVLVQPLTNLLNLLGLLGVVLVGVATAGMTASVAENPLGVHRSFTGAVLVAVIVGLSAVVGILRTQMGLPTVAGVSAAGVIGSVLAFGVIFSDLVSGGDAVREPSHGVTVRLVDSNSGELVATDTDVQARKISTGRGGGTRTRPIDVSNGEGRARLPQGTWEFDTRRGRPVRESVRGSNTVVRIEVEPTDVVFRTRTPDGDPVVGATVSFPIKGEERRLTTGDDGVARDQLPGDVTEIDVTLAHERYESVSGTLDMRAARRQGKQPGLDLEMEPLTGGLEAVVTLDGEDVADVAVVAEPGPDVVGGTERATTDRAGRAAFDALPIGEYTVGVDLEGAAQEFVASDSTVTVTEGETRTEGLPVRFHYRLGGESTRRIEEIRSRLDATTSHPRSDMSIPAFYASVVEELLRTVERVPEEGTTFLAAGRSPEETVDALLAAAEAGVEAVDEAMSDKQNVDLFAACADMEPAAATWDGSFSLADLFELAELQPGKRRGRVAERLDTVNDRISDELSGLSEVGPARSAWEQTRDLASDRSREGLEAAATTMLAEGLLEAIEALFEREALRERMTRTVF